MELANGLRAAMHDAGLDGKTVATHLGWTQSQVSRFLSGQRRNSESEVETFLEKCGVVDGPEYERLMGLARDDDFGDQASFARMLPARRRRYVAYQRSATAIGAVHTVVLPDLLRTDDYAWAVITADPTITPGEAEPWVVANQAQRVILTRPHPPTLTVVLHEHVLRLPVGGAGVMAEQLRHLLLMAWRPNISLRVIPTALGAHPSPAGSFMLLDLPTGEPVVYLDSGTDGVFLHHQDDIATYRTILHATTHAALSKTESRELIATVADEFSTSAPNDHAT
jgi:hypothetical protein